MAQGIASGYLAVMVLALYTNTEISQRLYARHDYFWGICLLLLYWISYLWMMATRARIVGDPVMFALSDRVSLGLWRAWDYSPHWRYDSRSTPRVRAAAVFLGGIAALTRRRGRRPAPGSVDRETAASQWTEYQADAPKNIVELQPFRSTASMRFQMPASEGVATLVNLNPRVNAWFLLTLRLAAERQDHCPIIWRIRGPTRRCWP